MRIPWEKVTCKLFVMKKLFPELQRHKTVLFGIIFLSPIKDANYMEVNFLLGEIWIADMIIYSYIRKTDL